MPSIANLVYELPNDFLKDFRLRILKNKKILGKSQMGDDPSAQSPLHKLNFGNSIQKTRKS